MALSIEQDRRAPKQGIPPDASLEIGDLGDTITRGDGPPHKRTPLVCTSGEKMEKTMLVREPAARQ